MDDMQRENPVAPHSPTSTEDGRGTTAAVLGQARLIANPRRVRRA